MRNPERIPKILFQIERVWESFPDMRLGQLLLNCVGEPELYYIEDEELVHKLLEMGYRFAKENING